MPSICDEEPYGPNDIQEYDDSEETDVLLDSEPTPSCLGYGRTDNNEETEKEYFYNIEKTDNPYIVRYIETEMENLSDNFKILNEELYKKLNVIENEGSKVLVIDIETLKSALRSYREQLLEDKNKVIIDVYLQKKKPNVYADTMFNTSVRQYLTEFGLSFGKSCNVSLKKVYKPKPKTGATTTVNRWEINGIFESLLKEYAAVKLGIRIKIKVTSPTIYNTLMVFKKLCPNVSYEELKINSQNLSYYDNKECEKFWNDPELAKPKPVKAKKEKKWPRSTNLS